MDANSNDELYPIAVLIDELKVGATWRASGRKHATAQLTTHSTTM
jgi:hypothetical protein